MRATVHVFFFCWSSSISNALWALVCRKPYLWSCLRLARVATLSICKGNVTIIVLFGVVSITIAIEIFVLAAFSSHLHQVMNEVRREQHAPIAHPRKQKPPDMVLLLLLLLLYVVNA